LSPDEIPEGIDIIYYHHKLDFESHGYWGYLSKRTQRILRHVLNWDLVCESYRLDEIDYRLCVDQIVSTLYSIDILKNRANRREMWLFILKYHHRIVPQLFHMDFIRFLCQMRAFYYLWVYRQSYIVSSPGLLSGEFYFKYHYKVR